MPIETPAQPAPDEQSELIGLLELMTSILRRFADMADRDIDAGIDEALASIGTFAGVDRSYLFLIDPDGHLIRNTHEWCARGIPREIDNLREVPFDTIHWWRPRLLRGESIYIPDVQALPESRAELLKRVELGRALRGSEERGELALHYQPVFDAHERRLLGLEALLRWPGASMHAQPSELIPVAEETGLIVPIGAWALDTALAQLRHWLDAHRLSPAAAPAISHRKRVDDRGPGRRRLAGPAARPRRAHRHRRLRHWLFIPCVSAQPARGRA